MVNIESSKEHFINKNKLETTYFFLTYFKKYTSQLVGIILEALIDKYKDIEEKTDMPEDLKKITLAEIEFEILCKSMEELETLASICNAFIDEENKIMDNIINFGKKGYPNTNDILEKLKNGNSIFLKLLTYPELESLDLDLYQKELLQRLYTSNIEALKIMFENLHKFYRKNITAYNKHKHSKTFCIVPFISEYNTHYAESIIFTKDKNEIQEFVIMHSKLIFDQYIEISKSIYILMNDLLENRTKYMEFKGHKLPPIQSYFEISETTKKVLNYINKKIMEKYSLYKTNVNLNFKVETDLSIINKNMEFYLNELYNSRLKKDETIEKLSQEIYDREKKFIELNK